MKRYSNLDKLEMQRILSTIGFINADNNTIILDYYGLL